MLTPAAPRVSELASFTSALHVKFTLFPGAKSIDPVSVIALPDSVYVSLNVIGPKLVPAGRSLVIVRFDAPSPNVNASPAAGIPCGDQFCAFDQKPFTAPVH